MAATVGGINIDLTLNSASFQDNMQKAAQAVTKNTGEIANSLEQMRGNFLDVAKIASGVFAGDFGLRAIERLKAIADESLKLAETLGGDVGDAAQKVEEELSSFKDAFDFGVAQGFVRGLNEEFKVSDDALGNLTIAGAQFGYVMSKALGETLNALQAVLPYVNTITLAFEEAADVMTGRFGAALDRMKDLGNVFTGASKTLNNDLVPGLQKFTLAMEEELRASKDANDTWKTSVEVSQEWADALRELPGIIRATDTPLEKYQKQIEAISMLQTNGKLTAEQSAKGQENAVLSLSDTYVGAVGQITSTLAGAFQDQKGFAIANAVMNVAEGVTKAFTLPFPLNWVQAAAVAAAGGAQIAAIESAQPGSASKATAVSSGGGAGSVGSLPSQAGGLGQAAGAGPAQQQSVFVTLNGQMFTRDQVAGLAVQLSDYVKDGGKLIVS